MTRKVIHVEEYEFICDHCGHTMEFDTVTLEFGYPSQFDGQRLHFCTDKHLTLWIYSHLPELDPTYQEHEETK